MDKLLNKYVLAFQCFLLSFPFDFSNVISLPKTFKPVGSRVFFRSSVDSEFTESYFLYPPIYSHNSKNIFSIKVTELSFRFRSRFAGIKIFNKD